MNYLRKVGLIATAALALALLGGTTCASATELYKSTSPNPADTLGVGTSIKGSLRAGTSLLREETTGFITDTCTAWGLEGSISSAGSETTHTKISLSSMSIGGCVNAMKFLTPGELEVRHIAGTTNGDVYLKNAEVTYVDTGSLFDCVVKIEAATFLGRLTGSSGSASMEIRLVLPSVGFCGSRVVKGIMNITTPSGLVVEAK